MYESKMNILSDLKQLYFLDKEIRQLEQDLLETESRMRRGCGLGGFTSHGGVSDITGNTVMAIMQYSNEIDRKVKELYEQKTRAEQYIGSLGDPVLRTVLRMRFVKFYGWWKIARIITPKERPCDESTPRKMVERFFQKL